MSLKAVADQRPRTRFFNQDSFKTFSGFFAIVAPIWEFWANISTLCLRLNHVPELKPLSAKVIEFILTSKPRCLTRID
jgi:hypothetical protein